MMCNGLRVWYSVITSICFCYLFFKVCCTICNSRPNCAYHFLYCCPKRSSESWYRLYRIWTFRYDFAADFNTTSTFSLNIAFGCAPISISCLFISTKPSYVRCSAVASRVWEWGLRVLCILCVGNSGATSGRVWCVWTPFSVPGSVRTHAIKQPCLPCIQTTTSIPSPIRIYHYPGVRS